MKLSKKFKRRLQKRVVICMASVSVFFVLFAVGRMSGIPVVFNHERILGNQEQINGTTDVSEKDTTLEKVSRTISYSGERLQNTDTITYIYDANDLATFRDSVNIGNSYEGKKVYVMADIDMSSVCSDTVGTWEPIGNGNSNRFAGTFDGNYHRIRNLYINNSTRSYEGLFNIIPNTGIVQNVILENVNILAIRNEATGDLHSGGIAASNNGTILNCGIESGSIIGRKTKVNTAANTWPGPRSGGIAGINNGTIAGCYNKATIESYSPTSNGENEMFAGGIAGGNYYKSIENCYNTGRVTGSSYAVYIGGIVGHTQLAENKIAAIKNCYNYGTITAGNATIKRVGGIAGRSGWSASAYAMPITNCYTTDNVTYSYSYWNGSTIANSTAGKVAANTLKTYTVKLGSDFAYDVYHKNAAYPVLTWENKTPVMSLDKNQAYIKVNETLPLQIAKEDVIGKLIDNKFQASNFTWSSTNEEVATVDENGVVTGLSDGYTTVYAYQEEKDLYAMMVVNVAKDFANPQIATGNGFTTILKADGTVWTLGNNQDGQLGNGTNENRNTPGKVCIDENTELTNVVKIAVGTDHVLALTKEGKVYSWGQNSNGQLGVNDTTSSPYAKVVLGEEGEGFLTDIVDISAGANGSAAIDKTGNLYVWGKGSDGEIGNNTKDSKYVPTKNGVEKAIQVSIGGRGSVAALTADGVQWSWGFNVASSLGINCFDNTSYPMKTALDVTEVSSSTYHSIIKKVDGMVYGAGENSHGRLGVGTAVSLETYTKLNLPQAVTQSNPVKYICAGRTNTILLLADGTIWETGTNGKGQLGNGTTIDSDGFVQGFTASNTPLENILTIGKNGGIESKGDALNTAIITKSGDIYTAGDNDYGQIGDGTSTNTTYYKKIGFLNLEYEDKTIYMKEAESQIELNKLKYVGQASLNVYEDKTISLGEIEFTSLNENIVTVDENGKIVAKGNKTGSVEIKIEDITNGYETYVTVIVDKLQNTDTITYIYNANDLVKFRDSVNAGNDYAGKIVYMMADIDMSTVCSETLGSFTPIGATGTNFAGTFNGKYHTISNLYVRENAYSAIGLFSQTHRISIIKNLIMENVEIYNEHSVVSNSVFAGGIVGLHKGEIINCGINSGTITGIKAIAYTGNSYVGTQVGGIVGCGQGKISSCYNKANIIAKASKNNYPNEAFAGGIIGVLDTEGNVLNCYSTGNLSAEGYQAFTGGIIASANKVSNKQSIKNSYGTGTTKATGGYDSFAGGIIGRTGWSSTYPAITMNNIYCTTNNTYSYYYWNGSRVVNSTAGRVAPETLKTYATTLGSAYTSDSININNGYPILKWELPRYRIIENQEYIRMGQSRELTLERIMFREEFEDNEENIEWTSSNGEVATVDESGRVTGKGIGHTTITAYNSKNGLKTRAIIHVYGNQKNAITIPQIVEQEGSTIVLKEDGTVWSSGLNDKGQLGDGTTTNRNMPVQVKITEDTYLTDVIKLTAGDHEGVVALTKNGEVYGWGSNVYGNLATGNQEKQVYAHKMEIGGNYKIIDVTSSNMMTHVLTENGDVYYVGTCIYDGYNYNNEQTTTYIFKEMPELEDTIKLESYGSFTGTHMAMKSDGLTLGWGYDRWGQLAQGTTTQIRNLTLVGTDIVDVEVGDYATIVQKEDGEFYTAGESRYGGTGVGTTNIITTFQKLSLPNNENGGTRKIVKAQRQGYNTVVLASDKTVWASGLNAVGQLSQGNTTNTSTFVQLKNNETEYLENAIDISSGEVFGDSKTRSANIGIIKEDGTVWLSGDNTNGQIGNGTTESSTYLTQMHPAFLKYPQDTITISVGGYQKIDKLLWERQEDFNVFIKEASTLGDLNYEIEDEEIATITSLGMIEGKKQGTTKVKVTDSNTNATTDITIKVIGVNLKTVMVNEVEVLPEETDKYQYKNNIKKLDTRVKIKITTEYEKSEIKIGEQEKQVGVSEQWIDVSLEEDVITIPVMVMTNLGETITRETYYIILTRQSNDTSAIVSYNETQLTKEKDGNYKVNILDTAETGKIKVVTNHEKAKVDIGNTTQYEEGSKEYMITIPSNITQKVIEVPISIMAEDGTIENSTVVITIIETNTKTAKVEGTYELEGKEITKQATIDEQGNYLIGVKENTKEIELKITAESQYATITKGNESGKGELITKSTLENVVTYVNYEVTAEDGKTTIQKTIKIVKQSSDAEIESILVDGKEAMIEEDGIYRATVEGGSKGAKVIITATSKVATIEMSGIANPNTNKAVLDTIVAINTIQNTYTITVTAEDGTIKIYTLKIDRQTNIAGKIITENVEGKHKAIVIVYKTSDKNPETNTTKQDSREIIARQETKEDGTYVVAVEDMEPYDIVITKLGYLDYRVTEIEVEKGEKTELKEVKLIAGDVVKSGQIEIDDLVALNDNFGVIITDENRDQKAIYDLNEDGKVDDLDREILKKNYGKKNKLEQWEDPKRIRRMRTRRVANLIEGQPTFILPIKGNYKITSEYGTRTHPVTGVVKKHTGIDLGGEHRTEIYAVADGEVVFAGVQNAFGNCIEVKHEVDGEVIYSFYAHLSRIDVKVGQEVNQGEVIALEGGDPNTDPNPGSSTGHHLHFELRTKSGYGNDVNPRDYIDF